MDSRGSTGPFCRHDLLEVDPAAWTALVTADPVMAGLPLLGDWARRGWPMIVRRPLAAAHGTAQGAAGVPAALALPRSHRPHRFAFVLDPAAILARRAPPALGSLESPLPWRAAIQAVLAVANEIGIEPRVFGSLMWQSATGLPYVSESSDLDLIWPCADGHDVPGLCCRLLRIEAATGLRLDGELIGGDGVAVQWREYASGAREILVKTLQGVELRAREHCLRAAARAIA